MTKIGIVIHWDILWVLIINNANCFQYLWNDQLQMSLIIILLMTKYCFRPLLLHKVAVFFDVLFSEDCGRSYMARDCHCNADVCHDFPRFCYCGNFEWVCPQEAAKGTLGYFAKLFLNQLHQWKCWWIAFWDLSVIYVTFTFDYVK